MPNNPLLKFLKKNQNEIGINFLTYTILTPTTFAITPIIHHNFNKYINDFLNNEEQTDNLIQCYLNSLEDITKMGPCISDLFSSDVIATFLLITLVVAISIEATKIFLRGAVIPCVRRSCIGSQASSDAEEPFLRDPNHSTAHPSPHRALIADSPQQSPRHTVSAVDAAQFSPVHR